MNCSDARMRSTNDATSPGRLTNAARTTSAITGWSVSRSGRMRKPSATGAMVIRARRSRPRRGARTGTLGTVLGRGDALGRHSRTLAQAMFASSLVLRGLEAINCPDPRLLVDDSGDSVPEDFDAINRYDAWTH